MVENQLAVLAQGAGDFLERFDARRHWLLAPLVEKLCSLGGRSTKLLESLFEKVSPNSLQVVAEEITEAEMSFGIQIPLRRSTNQRDFPKTGSRPSCFMRRVSS